MKHKHAELIKKWADGAKIQIKSENDDWEDVDPAWIEHCEYRIKPEYNQSKGKRMNEQIEDKVSYSIPIFCIAAILVSTFMMVISK